jgi:hypothetical protein
MTEKKRKILAWSVAGVLLVLEALGFIFVKSPIPEGMSGSSLVWTLVTFAIVFAIFYFLIIRKKGGEKIESDERTEGITQRAIKYSYSFSYISVFALLYLDEIGLVKLPGTSVLLIVAMIMAFSLLVSLFIVNRKGRID